MADSAPIPPPKDDDAEDVFWALSTATTLYQRGDRAEALRWLRRAAEQASDQDADGRALELMKAAAALTASMPPSPSPSVAPPAPRPSVPPPLPKRAAPPAPPTPSRPPPLPSAPPPGRIVPPGPGVPPPPSVPATRPSSPGARMPAPPAPSKPLARSGGRERHGTLTGRRGASSRRASSADLGKVPRPPGVPAEIPDAPIDDLDEETNVYEGKARSSKGRKPAIAEPTSKPAAPAPVIASPVKPAPISVPAKPQATSNVPVGRPIAAPITPPSKPVAPKDPAPAKTEPSAKAVSVKLDPPPKVAPIKADPPPSPATPKVEPAVAKLEAPPSKPSPETAKTAVAAEPVARPAALRKGTMQLVDEGFESMLDTPDPVPSAVPIFVELPLPPEAARGEVAESASPKKPEAESASPKKPEAESASPKKPEAETASPKKPEATSPAAAPATPVSGLLAQRVALIADPSGGARIVPIADPGSLPKGAIVAIVVPLSSEDGEPLARLLGQTKA